MHTTPCIRYVCTVNVAQCNNIIMHSDYVQLRTYVYSYHIKLCPVSESVATHLCTFMHSRDGTTSPVRQVFT